MKIFALILTTGMCVWSESGMAVCTPPLIAPVWLSKNVYRAESADVMTGGTIPGAVLAQLGMRKNIIQAVQNSDRESVRKAFAQCSQPDGLSIQLTKGWHPDVNGDHRTIHVTVRTQSFPNGPWSTCHVYAQANNAGSLATTCAYGEDAFFNLHPNPLWYLK